MPNQLPRMASVQALVPVELNYRIQNVCARSRVLFGDDYGVTFEKIVTFGLWAIEARLARVESRQVVRNG